MSLFDSPEEKEAKRQYKEEMKQLAKQMQPTGKIFLTAKWDDNLGVISCNGTLIKYDTIKDVQVNERVEVVTKTYGNSKKKHGITRAVVGGVIAGPIGAAVGGMTAKTENDSTSVTKQRVIKTLIVTRDDPYNPVLSFSYDADLELKLNSILKNNQKKIDVIEAEPITETLQLETSSKPEDQAQSKSDLQSKTISVADEIVKLKKLMDDGTLTEEEFLFLKEKLIKN